MTTPLQNKASESDETDCENRSAYLDILWRGDAQLQIPLFLLNLPIHLIACWSYQKADTVWAPLATLSIFNLVTSLLNIFLL